MKNDIIWHLTISVHNFFPRDLSVDNISFVIDYKESESTNDNPDEEISENTDDDQTSNDDQDGDSSVNNVDNETPGNTVIEDGTTNSLSGESEQDGKILATGGIHEIEFFSKFFAGMSQGLFLDKNTN